MNDSPDTPDTPDTPEVDEEAGTSVQDLKALLREAEEALGNSDSGASDEVNALRERLRDVLADGQSTLQNVSTKVRQQASNADKVVRSKPYQTLGIVAAVGLLVGYLISRSGSSKA